ncbi:MAG: peptidase [Frankiales bacterium]|nr:peptidase [Frankiales bacterium]
MEEAGRATALLDAQGKAQQLFQAIETAGLIRPGVTESEASKAIRALAKEQLGVTRHWHKRIVRSGPNTLLPYAENPPDRLLTDDDIAFVDLGPVFEQWEADFGRTWVLGSDPLKHKLCADLPAVFDAAKAYFAAHPDITGEQLHAEVLRLTAATEWEFGNYHCGHVVGEFPHVQVDTRRTHYLIMKGSDQPMRRPDLGGKVAHWILEIHLVDRARQIGGFYEELLTL